VKVIWELLKETFKEWQEDKAARLAAALSYYTVFSLAPLVIIVLAIIGLLYRREEASSYLIDEIQKLVGPSGAEVVQSIVENASQPSSSLMASIIGVGTLLLGASGVFGQLQDALNTIWGVVPKPGRSWLGMVTDRLLSMAMVVGIGFLLLVSLVVSAVLSGVTAYLSEFLPPSAGIVSQLLDFLISMAVITLLFAAIYKVLPDVKIKWRDVWMGAIVTALLFVLGKFLLGFYIGRQSFNSTYGAAGSILVLLLWVYYSAQILLFGAEFTQVYTKKFGSFILPDENAVLLTREDRIKQGIPHSQDVEAAISQH
jgi:membrane protein